MKKLTILLIVLFATVALPSCTMRCNAAVVNDNKHAISLSGKWQFMIDREGKGEENGWFKPEFKFDDTIELPGSMPQRMKGNDISVKTQWIGAIYDSSYYHNPFMEAFRREGNMKIPFFLTPCKHYVGKAWYKRTITLEKPVGKEDDYLLYLERPHITSNIWVNGEYVGSAISLSVPHSFSVGKYLKKGENTIVICINNDPDAVKVGNDSHSVTDQTQGCWNGIVGKIELRPFNRIEDVKVYPDVDNHKAKVHLLLGSLSEKGEKATIKLIAEAFNTATKHVVESKPKVITLNDDADGDYDIPLDMDLDMGEGMLLWDEFTPNLYRLKVEVTTKSGTDMRETVFGMRKIEINGRMFSVNGHPIFLRGNVDSCLFPDTGYPPTDLQTWIEIFEKQKKWGINHIRFHSYCPPEAAFLAADIVGMYIQPEGPSWPNHGVSLGRGQFIDTYLYSEAMRICDEYGNHPSFTFFAFGNEPAGNWVKWCSDHVPLMKKYDPRHIYAGFSVGGGWAWQPASEFAVKAGARGLAEWAKSAPESMADFTDKISVYNGKDMPGTKITVPFVTHEMGQWCVFPNFKEIDKYKGVNKAKNFEIFRDILRNNGMESRGNDFLMASGKLQALCYKYETERILRTPDYAGYQLLALNDYSGQGSALVGVTDVFFDEKGYVTAPEYREFCSPIVPLAKFGKFTYTPSEAFEAEILLSQYSSSTLNDIDACWSISRSDDATAASSASEVLAEGRLHAAKVENGLHHIGNISAPLSNVKVAGKYTLTVTVPGTEARNHWDIWVYPSENVADNTSAMASAKQVKAKKSKLKEDIYITDSLDAKALKTLQKGGKVLICAAGKVTYGREVVQQFLPVFWNTSWFKMRPPHTTGLFIESNHPVFDGFPTDNHSDLQWWELVNRAQVMQFTDFPHDFQPIVQSIDTWFVSRKIGMLFEAKVGKGRLMMTTMDITNDLSKRHVANALRNSILSYMRDDAKFNPQWSIETERIADLFTKIAGEVNMFTNESPDELKPTLK